MGFTALISAIAMVTAIVAVARMGAIRGELTQLRRRMDGLERSVQRREAPVELPPAAVVPRVIEASEVHTEAVETEVGDLAPKPPIAPATHELASDEELELVPDEVEPVSFFPPFAREISGSIERSVKRKAPISFEEMLGTKGIIWIGAVALAFAGAFAAKHAYENQVFGPKVSMSIVTLFGFAMIIAAHFLRHHTARIASGLAAAGVATLFTVVWASVHRFELIGPRVGFVCMAAVTVAAVVLSLRHGSFVALLGLLGGFATPVLMRTGEHDTAGLFTYLLLLEIGLVIVTRYKGWWPLSMLTLLLAMAWAGAWIVMGWLPGDSAWLGAFLVATVALFAIAGFERGDGEETGTITQALWPTARRDLAWAGAALGLLLVALLAHVGSYTNLEWSFLGVLSGGCLVLARVDKRYIALPFLAAATCAAMLISWQIAGEQVPDAQRLVTVAACLGVLFGVGGYAGLWKSPLPAVWAGLSVGSALTFLLIAYFAWRDETRGMTWAMTSLIIAAVYIAAATPIYRMRRRMTADNETLAALAVGIAAFVALAAPMALERQWITVAWALLLVAVVFIELQLAVGALRYIAGALAYLVAVRLLLNPEVLYYPVGSTPVFNWILYGYGIPTASFAAAAWLYYRDERKRGIETDSGKNKLLEPLQVGAMLLGFALITLEVRHFFHREALDVQRVDFTELGTYSVAWLAASVGLLVAAARFSNRLLSPAALVIASVAIATAILAQGIIANPVFTNAFVGEVVVFNAMLYVYGLPALLGAATAMLLHRRDETVAAIAVGCGSLALLGLYITLSVRHGFHRQALGHGEVSLIEWATYVNVWAALGALLLAANLRLNWRTLFYGGHVLGALAIGIGLLVLGIFANPLFTGESVGSHMVWNWLLYVYGLPAALAGAYAVLNRAHQRYPEATLAGSVALVTLFIFITMQVRQAWQGEFLNRTAPGSGEMYAYSAAWILLGVVLLAAGVTFRGKVLRWASLVVILVATGKVFLIDTAHLQGLYKVASFLGLGITLMAVGYVYQRFVFNDGKSDEVQMVTEV